MINNEFSNPKYEAVYNFLLNRYPKTRTNRHSDLTHLLTLESSFCLTSVYRNGTTSLLRDFVEQKNGVYYDAQSGEIDSLPKLEELLENGSTPIIIDEGAALFLEIPEASALSALYRYSAHRQIGIRLHPEYIHLAEALRERDFEIVEIGKILYAEFKAIMDKQCDAISYAFPEKYIQDAHTHYECLALSLYYLGEAFKLLVQNPGKMPTHQEIDAIMKRDYKHVKAREQL